MPDQYPPARSEPAVPMEERANGMDVESDVPEKMQEVTREEVEDFVSLAVRIFLKGGAYVHAESPGFPEFEVRVTEDMVVVNVRRLDQALAWRLAGPEEVKPPHPEELLSRWRIHFNVDDRPVAALGKGIPGVRVKTGHASLLLFRDFLRGLVEDKSGFRRAREAREERHRLEEEIEHSRERADALSECEEVDVEPGQEDLPGPRRFGPDVYERALDAERDELRRRYR